MCGQPPRCKEDYKGDSMRDSKAIPWDPCEVRLATAVMDMAEAANVRATAELYYPARLCSHCNMRSTVFVEPEGICAACWSLYILKGTADRLKTIVGRIRESWPYLKLAS